MNIYLIQQLNTNYFKIGITKKKVEVRLKELQIGSGIELKLVHSFKTNFKFKLETALHKSYDHKKVNSEWFELDDLDVNDFLKLCLKTEQAFEDIKHNYFFK